MLSYFFIHSYKQIAIDRQFVNIFMTKFPMIAIAAPGLFFGTAANKQKTLTDEVITCTFLKDMEMKIVSLPVTYEHNKDILIGYMDNLQMVQGRLVGDLYICDEAIGLDSIYDKYISPELLVKPNSMVYDMKGVSVVKYPAIHDNTPILKTNAIPIPYVDADDKLVSETAILEEHKERKYFKW